MRRSFMIPLALASALAYAVPAQAQLATPSCDALATWAQGYSVQDGWRPNALTGRAAFAALFADESTTTLFGKPVLEWNAEEAQALGPVLQACASEQARARNTAARSALNTLRTQVTREVPRYLTALTEARQTVTRSLETLEAADGSLLLLYLYLALAEMPAADADQRANQFAARQPQGPARDAARALIPALRTLPEAEIGRAVHPAATARIPTLRREVREALVQEIEGVEASPGGLRLLDRYAQTLQRDYAPGLGAEETQLAEAALGARRSGIGESIRDDLIRQAGETPLTLQGRQLLARFEQQVQRQYPDTIGEAGMAAVLAAIGQRRAEIGETIRDEIVRQVQASPLSIAGAQMLDRIHQQTLQQRGEVIGREGLEAVAAAIRERRIAIAEAVREELLAMIARMPPTPASLERLEAWASPRPHAASAVLGPRDLQQVREAAAARQAELGVEVAEAEIAEIAATPLEVETFALLDQIASDRLLALLPEAQAERLRAASAERRRTVAATLLPRLRQELAALPETDDALIGIDQELLPQLASWPDSAAAERDMFKQAARERREAILAAVNRAQAGPLRGRVYEGPFAKVEFIDANRVIATAAGAPPTAGTYEEIGDGRVIVTVNNEPLVFTREGARLISGPIALHRVQ
ncbi:hypothetical protein [Elioraea sp.]|uniref:hypothetical protein n=1 Tax=Elioraea sp. TaxID=2185103 RepID=UPI003F6F4872